MLASTLAILFSGALLALLGARDPKRLRSASAHTATTRAAEVSLPASLRRLCGWLVLLPGLVLAGAGQWWAFWIWFGATPALGWLIAQVLSRRTDDDRRSNSRRSTR